MQLFLLFLLSEKNFQKNHKFSLKNHFFWKRDDFEGGLSRVVGRDYDHSKENFFLYQNRLRWHAGICGISQNMEEKGGHLMIFWYYLGSFSKGLPPIFHYGEINRIYEFSGSFRPTEHGNETTWRVNWILSWESSFEISWISFHWFRM